MAKYTDDEIRNMKKNTCKIAGDYLGISSMAVSIEYSGVWVPPIRDKIPANRAMIPMCFQ